MRRYRWLAVPLVAVALVATACGGDDDSDDTGSGTATSTATATASDSTATAEATSAGGSAESDVDLDSIFEGFSTASFNITYVMEDGGDSDAMTGEWKWIQDVEGERTRFELTGDGETIIMITTPEQTLICSEGTCFDASGAMGSTMPDVGDMFTENIDSVQDEALTGTVRRIDGREIAGVDTECVEFEDEAADGLTGLACYAEGGIPLLLESETDGVPFRLEAIEYSSDISDSDFEAPFEVISMGG